MNTAKILKSVRHLTNYDGWVNLLTGLGISGKDKRVATQVDWKPLSEADASTLYAQDSIAAKVIDLLPEEAFKKPYSIKNLSDDDTNKLYLSIESLQLDKMVLKTCKHSRLYGGAVLMPISRDTRPMDEPFPMGSEITGFRSFNRWELNPQTQTQVTDISNPNFGKILHYTLNPRGLAASYNIFIHRSRINIMLGTELPSHLMSMNNYWGDSILTRLMPALQSYATAHDSISNVLSDFRVSIFKIKGLSDAISQDTDGTVMKRLEMLNLARSVARTVLVDADGEDFQYRDSNFTGIDSMIAKVEARLVAESEYPHTILLGESPSGSNATGNSTSMNWYDYVAGYQKNEIKPILVSAIKKIAAGLNISNYDELDIDFEPLWVMDEKESAEVRKLQAETDQIYISNGVIDPTEVGVSRFGGPSYSTETAIDMSLRKQGQLIPKVTAALDPNAKP